MGKKFLTKADQIKDDIDRINEILKTYNGKIFEIAYGTKDLVEINSRKDFLYQHLKELEISYAKYLENNEPYYEPNSYEYFKKLFSDKDMGNIYIRFACKVECIIDDDNIKPSAKVKILKNLTKAYKERENNLKKETTK